MGKIVPNQRLEQRLKKILPLVQQKEWDRDIPIVTASLRLAIITLGAENILRNEIPANKPRSLQRISHASDEQIAFALRAALR